MLISLSNNYRTFETLLDKSWKAELGFIILLLLILMIFCLFRNHDNDTKSNIVFIVLIFFDK